MDASFPGPQGTPCRDSRIGQLAFDHAQRLVEVEDSPSVEDAKRHLSSERLLAALAESHGLLTDKYRAFVDEKGIPRIQCGNRKLNLADFLTKEVHIEWVPARDLLVEMYQEQLRQEAESETALPEKVDASQEISAPVTAESEQEVHDEEVQVGHVRDKAADDLQSPSDPIGPPVPVTDLHEELVAAGTELPSSACPATSEEPDAAVTAALKPKDGALSSELSDSPTTPPTLIMPLGAAPSVSGPSDPSLLGGGQRTLTREQVEEQMGAHLWDQHDAPTVWFDGEQIFANPWDDEVVLQKLLELAHELFGTDLTLHGSEEFRGAVGRVAAEMNLDMSFTDEIAAECFAARRTELDQGQVPGM